MILNTGITSSNLAHYILIFRVFVQDYLVALRCTANIAKGNATTEWGATERRRGNRKKRKERSRKRRTRRSKMEIKWRKTALGKDTG